MHRCPLRALALAVGPLVALASLPGRAADVAAAAPPRAAVAMVAFAGVWLKAGGEAEEAAFREAVDRTARAMPFLYRSMARAALRSRTRPAERVELEVDVTRVWIASDGRDPRPTRLDGVSREFRADDGATATRSGRFAAGVIEIEWRRSDGHGSIAYRLSADGSELVVDETIHNENFEVPLSFRTTYRRDGT